MTTSFSDKTEGWTCRRCGRRVEPFLFEIALPGKPSVKKRIVPAHCLCEVEEWEREQARLTSAAAGSGTELAELPGAALGKRFAACRLANFEPIPGTERALREAEEFLSHWNREQTSAKPGFVPGLFLSGNVGVGKTRLAASLVNELAVRHRVISAAWAVPELLERLRRRGPAASDNDYLFEAVRRAPCLVLDDIGAERLTDWIQERLYLIIDYRYREELPTIITSNLTLNELTEQLSHRIASRIVGMTRLILIKGAADFRVNENRRHT